MSLPLLFIGNSAVWCSSFETSNEVVWISWWCVPVPFTAFIKGRFSSASSNILLQWVAVEVGRATELVLQY